MLSVCEMPSASSGKVNVRGRGRTAPMTAKNAPAYRIPRGPVSAMICRTNQRRKLSTKRNDTHEESHETGGAVEPNKSSSFSSLVGVNSNLEGNRNQRCKKRECKTTYDDGVDGRGEVGRCRQEKRHLDAAKSTSVEFRVSGTKKNRRTSIHRRKE